MWVYSLPSSAYGIVWRVAELRLIKFYGTLNCALLAYGTIDQGLGKSIAPNAIARAEIRKLSAMAMREVETLLVLMGSADS